jgi:hypothetical protein
LDDEFLELLKAIQQYGRDAESITISIISEFLKTDIIIHSIDRSLKGYEASHQIK